MGSLQEIRGTLKGGVHELPHHFGALWGEYHLLLKMPDEVMGEHGPMLICYPSVVGMLDNERRITNIEPGPVELGECVLCPKTGNLTPTTARLEQLAEAVGAQL